MPHSPNRRCLRAAVPTVVIITGLFGCAAPESVPPPRNPFVGTWANADNDTITIRQDTVVQNQANGQSTPLDRGNCDGNFSFSYTTSTRQELAGLLPRQPNFDQRLSALLAAPTYRTIVLRCGQGDHTYVLLNDHELVAVYRDGDIGVVERLARR